MLADGEVHALNEGGIDLPATSRQHLLDRFKRAAHDPVPHADQTAPPHGLDHLRIEQPGRWHPARFRRRALCPLARRLDPLTVVCQQRRRVLLEAVGQEEGHAARG